MLMTPTAVAARTKTPNIFAHSNTGIVGSNRTTGMDACLCASVSVVLCR
jgi:hypothetical protein